MADSLEILMTEAQKQQKAALDAMWVEPFEELSSRIMKASGSPETAKAILNARAIAQASQAGLDEAKDLVKQTRRLVIATFALVFVDLMFRLIDLFMGS